jgi:hypothetical protein
VRLESFMAGSGGSGAAPQQAVDGGTIKVTPRPRRPDKPSLARLPRMATN